MKLKLIIAMLFLLATVLPARADWFEDAVLFATGFVSGVIVHELGHELTARAYGEKLAWRGTQWTCTYPCDDIENIALAGNLATAIVGETLLHLPYKNAFVDGMQTFNTMRPILYALEDAVFPSGHLDYRYVDDRVQLVLAIHAASLGYRHTQQGRWRIGTTGRSLQFSRNF
jgi:hypothetical protein